MTRFILKNNQLINENQASISINERGFLFGDGIFETCKIFAGRIYDYKSHEARIKKGLAALKITADIGDLEKNSKKLIAKNKIENGILRISITRGVGSNGYLPENKIQALIIIQTFDERKLPKKISLNISAIKKPTSNSFPITHKTNNALPYVLNKIAANEAGFFDSIMLSANNFITETSAANIFWIKNNKIYTSSKSCDILPGTIRARLIKISSIKIIEKEAKLSELKNADEVFLTNSASLIIFVDEIDFGNGLIKKFLKKNSAKMQALLLEDVKNYCK
jgi:branched-subunit amino acid aminotransferase/4-amino-4-deoxychorismate lyase